VAAIEGLLCREYAPVWHTIALPVPLSLIHQDAFELAWKNCEIATQPWRFQTNRLDDLRATGLHFADATLGTLIHCQRRYIETSPKIQDFMRRNGNQKTVHTRLIQMRPTANVRARSLG
jgi:hypothetical protein